MRLRLVSLAVVVVAACGGGTDVDPDAPFRAAVIGQMHDALSIDIHALVEASTAIQTAAPSPDDRGWDATKDALAIEAMKSAWTRARSAYEHVEGAVAPLFPDIDFALDSRYEDYLAVAGPTGDAYAFDASGVVGLDAIERIVWADAAPAATVAYEKSIAGYSPAAFPATAQEAADFKNVLCAKLVADATALENGWNAHPIDVSASYSGLLSLVTEQHDEVVAQAGSEESRYSQTTMDDLRSNAEGIQAIYGIFRPWLTSKAGGDDVDTKIEAGLTALQIIYAAIPGDALPEASSSDYTQLLTAVTLNVDPKIEGTIAFEMFRARSLLGL